MSVDRSAASQPDTTGTVATVSRSAEWSVPTVDLTPLFGPARERRELAHHVTEICHEIGFLVVVHHGVPATFIDSVFEMMGRFFALPDEQKALIDKTHSRHFRGWEAVGAESTNNRPDIREQIDIWTERTALAPDVEPNYLRLLGPNQWMPESVLASQRTLTLEWFARMGELADGILGLLSIGLGLDEGRLRQWFGEESMSLTKLISYPPTPKGQAGVNAHHDAGFLTVLAAGSTPGLEVLDSRDEWVAVPPVPGGLVINIGEMLQAVTGNYLVATPHRVFTRQPRLSAGYFHGPSLNTPLTPLDLADNYRDAVAASPRHASAGFMASREQTDAGVGDMQSDHRAAVYGEQLWNYFARSYPSNMALHYGAA
jgi:isopenicillin N synthase-like dioxygenase